MGGQRPVCWGPDRTKRQRRVDSPPLRLTPGLATLPQVLLPVDWDTCVWFPWFSDLSTQQHHPALRRVSALQRPDCGTSQPHTHMSQFFIISLLLYHIGSSLWRVLTNTMRENSKVLRVFSQYIFWVWNDLMTGEGNSRFKNIKKASYYFRSVYMLYLLLGRGLCHPWGWVAACWVLHCVFYGAYLVSSLPFCHSHTTLQDASVPPL